MSWNPRDTRRWGSRVTQFFDPASFPVGAVFNSPELARAEGPAPATWNAFGTVRGVSAADLAAITWEAVLVVGVGAFTEELVIPFTPPLFTVALLPAQVFSIQIRATNVGGIGGGDWTFGAGLAPMTQWEGTVVTPDGD